MNIINLVGFNTNLQFAHWKAPTKTNEHSALGELYETMIDLTDTFVETYFGSVGSRELGIEVDDYDEGKAEIELSIGIEPYLLLEGGLSIVKEMCDELSDEDDEDLKNILADMRGAINKTKYKLQDV